jgi:glycosyltransferase involved in cell wall biosynthesis
MRVAMIMEGYGPYRVPFWNEFAKKVKLSLILLSRIEKGRQWRFEPHLIHCETIFTGSHQTHVPRLEWTLNWAYSDVRAALDKTKADVVVVGGWSSPGYWAARNWATSKRIPLVFWSESHALSSRTVGLRVFDLLKRKFLSPFKSAYALSPLSAEYLARFGFPREQIIVGHNIPDIAAFAFSEKLNPTHLPVLLYVGRFIEGKGLRQFLDSLRVLKHLQWTLLLAGSGPLEDAMRARLARDGLSERARFLGYVQQDALSHVYRQADILVFPTLNEVWGFVVHEALLSGVYVVGSDRAAACHTLIKSGVNGVTFSPTNHNDMTATIVAALQKAPFDRSLIRRSVKHITLEAEVAKLRTAIDLAAHSA